MTKLFKLFYPVNDMKQQIPSLIKEIVKKKTTCIFVSPHLDDAALSCGGLISYLCDKTKVIVVNVFTEAGDPPYTLSGKTFLRSCGFKNAADFYKRRRDEDGKAFKTIKVRPLNLGFTDALWRKNPNQKFFMRLVSKIVPEFGYNYKIARFHLLRGVIADGDKGLVSEIRKMLSQIISDKKAIIFCPISIGDHVDHIIVRDICSSLKRKTVYWMDYPYCVKTHSANGFWDNNTFRAVSFNENQKDRMKLIKGYKTQIAGLFSEGKIHLIPERYFYTVSKKI